jgi:YesN/AraC family two-component response regulator
MDPLTAFGLASTAFGAIKTAFEHGREIESMIGDIGRWSNAVYDFDAGHQREKQRLNRFATIEEEALESYLYKQRIKEQENELRNMMNMRFGPTAWQEVVEIQKQIRLERKRAREQAQIEHDKFIYNMCMLGIVFFFASAVIAIGYTIVQGIWFS